MTSQNERSKIIQAIFHGYQPNFPTNQGQRWPHFGHLAADVLNKRNPAFASCYSVRLEVCASEDSDQILQRSAMLILVICFVQAAYGFLPDLFALALAVRISLLVPDQSFAQFVFDLCPGLVSPSVPAAVVDTGLLLDSAALSVLDHLIA
ncbi:hypothetical protein B0O80DRAFT_424045 [Mortierella sp. GBAus27b]|nr:hypothetical protein B0O80DRAFT_424045 [Mortierella sp. GBAus27b]